MTDEAINDLALIASSGDSISADAALDLINTLKRVRRNYARLRDAVEKAQPHFDQMADRVYAPWCKIQDRFQRAMAEQPTSFDREVPEAPVKRMSAQEAVNVVRSYAESDIGERGLVSTRGPADAALLGHAAAGAKDLAEAIEVLLQAGIKAAVVYENHVEARRASFTQQVILDLVAQADRVA